ncbi:uncharacterized protein LOC127792612 isoform X3 [Diospyros lotus]|uniref:uncharacterized protein LOC127792612 isoform X3 n=1 Tax=Diospyros lotus TaxID=55363 RepID=UPI002252FF77|nr:uncharacterized protein LOC127792612 isoform X3 [Diospyros lotus]
MGSYRPGFSNNIDPKFGWCWRKEEKKWLCLKDVILNDKYFERHMNIGYYNGSRKSVERGTGETSRSSLGVKAAKNSEQARQMHLLILILPKLSRWLSLCKSHANSHPEAPHPMDPTEVHLRRLLSLWVLLGSFRGGSSSNGSYRGSFLRRLLIQWILPRFILRRLLILRTSPGFI